MFQGLSWYPVRSLPYAEIGGGPKSLLFNLSHGLCVVKGLPTQGAVMIENEYKVLGSELGT